METHTLVWVKKIKWLKAEKISNEKNDSENQKNTIKVNLDGEIIHFDSNLLNIVTLMKMMILTI